MSYSTGPSSWTEPTNENLAALADKYAGRSGDSESETIIRWDKSGHVSFWSCVGSHIANTVKRNPGSVIRFRDEGESVAMELNARPPHMILRNGNPKPMSESTKAKLRDKR